MRAAGVALLACGLSCAQATFEVASIKPAAPVEFGRTSVRRSVTKEKGVQGRLNYQGISLMDLIGDAYRVQHRQISGPDWLTSQRFDILALIPAAENNDQIPEMLTALLQERFKLKTHEDTKEEQVYRLVLANNGPKLQKAEKETGISGRSNRTADQVNAQTTLSHFAEYLSERLDRPVVDQTGLTGVYSIHVEWTPDTAPATGVDATGPSIFTAVREQLGLRLVSGKTPVQLLVVDSTEKYPTDN
ncbi:MAG: TIGR03435 family protein [Acidobacteriota bacterium]|nr:TIGR03435 family protein [Acidobacteriota bacterium]